MAKPKAPGRTAQQYAEDRRAAKHERNKEIEIAKASKPNYGRNSPVIGDNGLQVEPGDNAKYISHTMQVADMPIINLKDNDEVTQRISDYFNLCLDNDLKPVVSGLALSLGIDRSAIAARKGGYVTAHRVPDSVVQSIKKAYVFMENMWENYMQNGKINPTAGVFLGANNYGYQDVRQIIVAPVATDPLGEAKSLDDVRGKYLSDVDADYIISDAEPVTDE